MVQDQGSRLYNMTPGIWMTNPSDGCLQTESQASLNQISAVVLCEQNGDSNYSLCDI